MNANPNRIKSFKIRNSKGMQLCVLNYGAAIFSLNLPDKNGNDTNVIASPKEPEEYLTSKYKEHNKCFGASVGRYAGRISNGEFELNGEQYILYQNNGVHLHGGKEGFQYKYWDLKELKQGENPYIKLSYFSIDAEEGYPGNLKVMVTFTLTENNILRIEYKAETDKETVINLTNHAYFNLNGKGDISNHLLQINAEEILETDKKQLPTGNFIPLASHPKNFMQPKEIGDQDLDDTFVLKKEQIWSASLFSLQSGIKMQVKTNQPAIVGYAPEDLPSDWEYKTAVSQKNPSICLETQNFSDAPNHPDFPSSILKPRETYYNKSEYEFSLIP